MQKSDIPTARRLMRALEWVNAQIKSSPLNGVECQPVLSKQHALHSVSVYVRCETFLAVIQGRLFELTEGKPFIYEGNLYRFTELGNLVKQPNTSQPIINLDLNKEST